MCVCVCAHAHACVFIDTCEHVEARSQPWVSFLRSSPLPLVLRQSLSVSLVFEVLARLAAGKSPGDIDIYTHLTNVLQGH